MECVRNTFNNVIIDMKKVSQILNIVCLAAILAAGSSTLVAQDTPPGRPRGGGGGGGGFDPAQMRQRMMERYREQFKVKDDAEWKLIEERVAKVTEARMQMGGRGGFGGFGGRGGRGANGGGDQAGRPGGAGADQADESSELQKAIESDAPAAEIKTKLEKYRGSLKNKEAALGKAQDDLRKVLSVRQEAAAVLAGLLK